MVTELSLADMQPGAMQQDDYMHVVMFYGVSCNPCKFTMPFYEEVSKALTEAGARIKFYKFHVWESDETKQFCREKFNVQGVPHFKAFTYGNVVQDKIGGGNKEDLTQFIQNAIDVSFKELGARI